MNLRVRVNDELLLDVGLSEERGSELIICPPRVTLFRQILDYLRTKSDPVARPIRVTVADEGVAAAAVALRWGSYLAVLVDDTKPVWVEARSVGTSRISNSEMARINIEASAALAEWIDIARGNRHTYEKLVIRAAAYLPMRATRPTAAGSDFAMLAVVDVASPIVGVTSSDSLVHVRADAQNHASRIFTNALVNVAWRNGPVEDLHAGTQRGYPLDHRRVTVAEERMLLDFATDRLTTGMDVCRSLQGENGRSWPEQVLTVRACRNDADHADALDAHGGDARSPVAAVVIVS